MSGNIKFRWFLLAPIVLALFVVVISFISLAGARDDFLTQEFLKRNPENAIALAWRAKILFRQGSIGEAIKFCTNRLHY